MLIEHYINTSLTIRDACLANLKSLELAPAAAKHLQWPVLPLSQKESSSKKQILSLYSMSDVNLMTSAIS